MIRKAVLVLAMLGAVSCTSIGTVSSNDDEYRKKIPTTPRDADYSGVGIGVTGRVYRVAETWFVTNRISGLSSSVTNTVNDLIRQAINTGITVDGTNYVLVVEKAGE